MAGSKVVNETGMDMPEGLISKCSNEALRQHYKGEASLAIVLVSPEKIQGLNRDHYKKDAVTDVLSFEADEDGYIGEVVICPSYIRDNYQDDDKYLWELCHAAVHGTFHLIGFHHEESEEDHKRLHALEKEIINNILN